MGIVFVSFSPLSLFFSAIRLPCRLCACSAALSRSVKRSAFAVALVMHQGSYGRRTAECQGSVYRRTAQRLDRTALSRCIFRASVALTQQDNASRSPLGFAAYLLSSSSSSYHRLQGAPCQHTHTQTTASLMQSRSFLAPLAYPGLALYLQNFLFLFIRSLAGLQELAVPIMTHPRPATFSWQGSISKTHPCPP